MYGLKAVNKVLRKELGKVLIVSISSNHPGAVNEGLFVTAVNLGDAQDYLLTCDHCGNQTTVYADNDQCVKCGTHE